METVIKKIDENIYAIDQEMVRSFVITGQKQALIIDTGAFPVDFLALVRQVTSLPFSLCLTHSDIDHITNLDQFDQVYLHGDETAGLQDHDIRMKTVKEGDTFDLGGMILEVIHTPGHTPGSICLLDRQHHLLFSGDTVSYGPVYMFGKQRNMDQYIHSLKKLNDIVSDDILIYPCHNTCPISKEVISQLLTCIAKSDDHSLIGKPWQRDDVLLYQYQHCGILRAKNEQ